MVALKFTIVNKNIRTHSPRVCHLYFVTIFAGLVALSLK